MEEKRKEERPIEEIYRGCVVSLSCCLSWLSLWHCLPCWCRLSVAALRRWAITGAQSYQPPTCSFSEYSRVNIQTGSCRIVGPWFIRIWISLAMPSQSGFIYWSDPLLSTPSWFLASSAEVHEVMLNTEHAWRKGDWLYSVFWKS